MTGERAMNSFAKIKEREIIPILAWCYWKVRNLTVFDNFNGSTTEAVFLVIRFAQDVIKYQASEIRGGANYLLDQVALRRIDKTPLGKEKF